jgi:hypothetical protein
LAGLSGKATNKERPFKSDKDDPVAVRYAGLAVTIVNTGESGYNNKAGVPIASKTDSNKFICIQPSKVLHIKCYFYTDEK